jgi:hypothetical protein
MALGPLYPLGMFVAQNGDRDFQMVRWQDIATALGLAIDTQGYNVRGVSDCASVASVNVVPASASVEVGATLQLGATLRDGGGAPLFGCALTWSTSDDAIATVGANGLVTGVFQGPATITATSGGVSGSSAITVPAPPVATGLRSPTANAAVTSSAGDNNGFQTSPANAHAGDGLFAVDTNSGTGTSTSCTNNGKDKHLFYNYGLSIPPGSTIKGIEVRLDAKVDSTSGSPKFCVQLSSNGGASWTAAKSTARLATSGATYMLGSATDTWGRSWTVGDLADAGFRVRVISVANSTSRDFSLDWIAVRVTYQPSP